MDLLEDLVDVDGEGLNSSSSDFSVCLLCAGLGFSHSFKLLLTYLASSKFNTDFISDH